MKKFIDRPARLFIKNNKIFVRVRGKKYIIKNQQDYTKRELIDIILKELIVRRRFRQKGRITKRERKLDRSDLHTFEEFEKLNRNQSKALILPPNYTQASKGTQSFFSALVKAFDPHSSDINTDNRSVKNESKTQQQPSITTSQTTALVPTNPSNPPPLTSTPPETIPPPLEYETKPIESETSGDIPEEKKKKIILKSEVEPLIMKFIKDNGGFRKLKKDTLSLIKDRRNSKEFEKQITTTQALINYMYQIYNNDYVAIKDDIDTGKFMKVIPIKRNDKLNREMKTAVSDIIKQTADGRKYTGKGLTTDQIDDIMKIYGRQYVGTVPADFLTHIDTKKLPTQFGFVMNLDSSQKAGSHWVAVYIDMRDSIEYYDSFARAPSKSFLKQIKILLDKLKPTTYLKLKINMIKDQNVKTANCGFFAISFLSQRFGGKPFREVTGYDDSRKGERDIKAIKEKFGYI
jgi:hypothetical protein